MASVNIQAQTLLPNQKIRKLDFETVSDTAAVHSFENSGYVALVIKASSAAVVTFGGGSENRREHLGTGSSSDEVLNIGAGEVSVMTGFLARQFNKEGSVRTYFTTDAAVDVAVIQLGNVSYDAAEVHKYEDIAAAASTASDALNVIVDNDTVVIGEYIDAGGATLNGDGSADETGYSVVHSFISDSEYTNTAGDYFASFPFTTAFGSTATLNSVGSIKGFAINIKDAGVKALTA